MVPKLHAKGTSFTGLMAYVLHDADRAKTSHRVAWAETRNLATANPELAGRVMAATAMDQARLKQRAGIKNTGRKSLDHVLHLTLSWHPDEKGVGRDEMIRASLGAIRALGADDRQAVIVSHTDQPQPHVHIVVNRVSPTDGRILPSSNEKLALSRWAEAYEKQRGRVLCEERVVNNAARNRGEFVRGPKDRPRHLYELEAANDNGPEADRVRAAERGRDAEAALSARELSRRHREQRRQLELGYRQGVSEIKRKSAFDVVRHREAVRDAFRPRWRELLQRHERERAAFDQNEDRSVGRVGNALRAIDFRAMLRRGERRRAISEAFHVIASRGARLGALKREQLRREQRLAGEQRRAEREATADARRQRKQALVIARREFRHRRIETLRAQQKERAQQRAVWKRRGRERRAAWQSVPRDPGRAAQAVSAKEQVRRRRTRTRDRDRDDPGRGRGR